MDGSTVILGIEIASTEPIFLGIIAIHIPLGLACVIAGAIAMLSTKGPGRHSIAGRVYYWCLGALFVSATLLTVMRWAEDYHLFVFKRLPSALHGWVIEQFRSVGRIGRGCTLQGWASHTL